MQSLLDDARDSLRDSPVFAFYVLAALAVAGFTGLMVGQMALGIDLYLPGLFGEMQHGATESHRVHDYTFAFLVSTSVVGVLAQLARPSRNVAGAVMALVPFVGLALASWLSGDPGVVGRNPFQYIAAVALVAVLLHPRAHDLLRSFTIGRVDRVGIALVAVASIPLLAYASTQIRLQDTVRDQHAGMGHYGMMAAFSFTVIGLGILSGLRLDGWRVPAWATGLLSILVGAMSVVFPDVESSLDQVWALAAMAWGGLFIAVGELRRRASEPTPPSPSDPRTSPVAGHR